jgi:hypothetical protein
MMFPFRPVAPFDTCIGQELQRMSVMHNEDIWAGYDPEKVKEALKHTAGSWADLDTDSLIAELYEARSRGSRPGDRSE